MKVSPKSSKRKYIEGEGQITKVVLAVVAVVVKIILLLFSVNGTNYTGGGREQGDSEPEL